MKGDHEREDDVATRPTGTDRWKARAVSAGKAVIYAAVGITALVLALGLVFFATRARRLGLKTVAEWVQDEKAALELLDVEDELLELADGDRELELALLDPRTDAGGLAGAVVDDLGRDVLGRTEHGEARALSTRPFVESAVGLGAAGPRVSASATGTPLPKKLPSNRSTMTLPRTRLIEHRPSSRWPRSPRPC